MGGTPDQSHTQQQTTTTLTLHIRTNPPEPPTPYTTNFQVAKYLLSLDKEGRTPDLRWLDEEGCAVVHRVAAAGDVALLEHLLQVCVRVCGCVWMDGSGRL